MQHSFRPDMSAVLIATLGSEPQVVTSALTLLGERRQPVLRVHVVHTTQHSGPIREAVDALQAASQSGRFPAGIALQFHPVRSPEGKLLDDIHTPDAGRAAFQSLYTLIREEKQSSARVHLLIAGGRKTMSIYGMVAAQLLFDDDDCLWHLHSSGDFLASRRMFPQTGDQVQLVPIPVIPWRQVSPALTDLRDVADPFVALERFRSLRLDERMQQARAFVETWLTPAERRVVALLVTEGLPDGEIASRLHLSSRTVEHHLRAVFRKAAACWDLAEVNRALLITLLNLYYTFLLPNEERIGENTDGSG